MQGLLFYAISVMWTPGPVNTIMLNIGMKQGAKRTLPFLVGVSVAMALLVIIYGFIGKSIEKYVSTITFYMSIVGACYMLYLSYKLFSSKVNLDGEGSFEMKFQQGFWMQLLNPKGTLCALPIATIYLPALQPSWLMIVLIALLVSAIGGVGVFTIYALTGSIFKQLVKKPIIFQVINYVMASILLYLAFKLLYEHVFC